MVRSYIAASVRSAIMFRTFTRTKMLADWIRHFHNELRSKHP